MSTFNLYKLDQYNYYKSVDAAVFDTFIHIDPNLPYDEVIELELPEGWSVGEATDGTYAIWTKSGITIDERSVGWSKMHNTAFCTLNGKKYLFKRV